MILQHIVVQRHRIIVSVDRLGRLEDFGLLRNLIEIADEVQEWLNLFTGSAIQIGIETNKRSPPLINFRDKLN